MSLVESVLMLEEDPKTPVPEELLLTDEDFPSYFVDKHHPDDYKITDHPIQPEHIFHEVDGRHPRLILRCSVKLAVGKFCSMSFVLDTGAPKIYLCDDAAKIMTDSGIRVIDKELGIIYVTLLGRKYRVEKTPDGHSPANIIGLKTLCRWGLRLHDEPVLGFTFDNGFNELGV